MDGGSSDGSIAILQNYKSEIYWESKKDKGQADAINKGLKKAKGEILAYLNSDDYYNPNVLREVIDLFEKNPSIMWVVGDAAIVDSEGREIQSFVRTYKQILRRLFSPSLLFVVNPIPQPSVFWRQEVTRRIGIFAVDLHYTMDYEYWLRIQKEFGRPYFLKMATSSFRIHSASKGGTQYTKQFAEELAVARRYTRNRLLLTLHALHNRCILLAYKLLK